MSGIKRVCAIVLSLLAVRAFSPADAQEQIAPLRDYERGEYVKAREAARGLKTADGFELACRAGIVIGSYLETGAQAVSTLHASLNDCLRAIKIDSARPDARITFAIGVGFEAKRLNNRRYAEASRRIIERAGQEFPQHAFAHAALAGWHYSASKAGFLERIAIGASRNAAQTEFDAALALAPDNFAISYEFVRFLCDGDKRDRAAAAEAANHLLSQMSPRDEFENRLASFAATLKQALAEGDAGDLESALDRSEPFRDIEQWNSVDGYAKRDIDFVLNIHANGETK